MKTITVLAAVNQRSLETNGADVEQTQCETVKEAKERAKYYLTEDFMRASESAVRLGYSQVLVDGKVLHDFFWDDDGKYKVIAPKP